ncbi:hypothetical protein DFJ73DRAFT_782044 [Zopfochytrium polystomum]|nr:hypothetical protein DFJ73DRAFT_782044 [Zopfochytrium polystomum]
MKGKWLTVIRSLSSTIAVSELLRDSYYLTLHKFITVETRVQVPIKPGPPIALDFADPAPHNERRDAIRVYKNKRKEWADLVQRFGTRYDSTTTLHSNSSTYVSRQHLQAILWDLASKTTSSAPPNNSKSVGEYESAKQAKGKRKAKDDSDTSTAKVAKTEAEQAKMAVDIPPPPPPVEEAKSAFIRPPSDSGLRTLAKGTG